MTNERFERMSIEDSLAHTSAEYSRSTIICGMDGPRNLYIGL